MHWGPYTILKEFSFFHVFVGHAGIIKETILLLERCSIAVMSSGSLVEAISLIRVTSNFRIDIDVNWMGRIEVRLKLRQIGFTSRSTEIKTAPASKGGIVP